MNDYLVTYYNEKTNEESYKEVQAKNMKEAEKMAEKHCPRYFKFEVEKTEPMYK